MRQITKIVLLLILNCLDWVLTLFMVNRYAQEESNPIAVWFIDHLGLSAGLLCSKMACLLLVFGIVVLFSKIGSKECKHGKDLILNVYLLAMYVTISYTFLLIANNEYVMRTYADTSNRPATMCWIRSSPATFDPGDLYPDKTPEKVAEIEPIE